MQVEVNGRSRQVTEGLSLADLVASAVRRADGVAVAVNRAVVPRSNWASRVLQGGDQVEIIQAVGGG